MTTLTLTVEVPTGEEMARVNDAMRSHFGQVEDAGEMRDLTDLEVLAKLKDQIRGFIVETTKQVEAQAAAKAAVLAVAPINAS